MAGIIVTNSVTIGGVAIDSLDDLASFVAIIDAGSFSGAARRQGLTVNAVSRRLQQLERALGVKLLERTTRRSEPTDAGRRLYAKAVPILDALQEAEAHVLKARARVEGTVRVALPPAIVTPSLLGALQRLLAEHAELRLDLRVGSADLPGEAGLDIALSASPPPESLALVCRKLGLHGWGLAAAPSYLARRGAPRAPADLSSHDCLRFRGDVAQRSWTLTGPRGKSAIVEVGGAFECDDSRVLGDATYAGLGIGVRPEQELAQAVRGKALVHVLPGWRFGVQPAYLLTTVGRRELPRVRVVMAALETAVQSLR